MSIGAFPRVCLFEVFVTWLNMETTAPVLEQFRQDWMNEWEEERLLELTRHREMSTASTSTLRPGDTQSRESTATSRNVSEFRNLTPEESLASTDVQMEIDPVDQATGEEYPADGIIFAKDFGQLFMRLHMSKLGIRTMWEAIESK